MGKFKRIAMKDIKAMQKTLDDLPDKNLGKTREEAVELLDSQIRKALEKGYTVRELSEIMADGNVSIPPPVIRARLLPKGETTRKRASSPSKARDTASAPADAAPASAETPSYYTPDIPDSEL